MDFWDFFWLLLIFIPLIMLWAFALVDIFRRDDLSGPGKVVWIVLVIAVPFFGTLIYMLFRPAAMRQSAMIKDEMDPYTSRAGSAIDNASQVRTLADLHDRGKLTDAEFSAEKQRILGV